MVILIEKMDILVYRMINQLLTYMEEEQMPQVFPGPPTVIYPSSPQTVPQEFLIL